MNELLDIVNDQDQVIDQQYRSEIYKQKLTSFRVINAFLMNDKKQLWIPCRTKYKKLFPLCLDASVGGHVMAGEDYLQAFERETREELNLDVNNSQYKLIAKLTPHEHKVSAFMHLYVIYTNSTPSYNLDDFESAQWINLVDLSAMIKDGVAAKGDLQVLIDEISNIL